MRLDTIAVRSLWRRKGKLISLTTALLLAIGTTVSLYLTTSTTNRVTADAFDELGANILVIPKASAEAASYAGVSVPGPAQTTYLDNNAVIAINTIKNRQNIAYVAPKIIGQAKVEGYDAMLIGVDFPAEIALKKWWRFTGRKPQGTDEALLGHHLAQRLGKKPGDRLRIGNQEFRVAAILEEQGNEEDEALFLQLLAAQRLLQRENRLSMIEVAAYCTTCPIDQIVAQIREKLPEAKVTAIKEVVKARQQVVDRFNRFSLIFSALVVLSSAFLILLIFSSWVRERTAEVGVYRALGYRRRHVLEIILTEALLVGLGGGTGGYFLGVFAARRLAPILAQVPLSIPFNPLLGGAAVLLAVGIALLASLYPAARAARLDPVEALRFV